MTKMFILVALVACSKTDDTKPAAAADPWATPSPTPAPAEDPWAAKSPPEQPAEVPAQAEPPPQAAPQEPAPSGGASTLAGSYQCQQLRYGQSFNGTPQSNYVSSALGVFEVDGDGAYRSASYPTKGTGQLRVDTANNVTFEGGAYAGSVGVTGSTSSGLHIRFSENLTEPPKPSMQFNDHMCYRK